MSNLENLDFVMDLSAHDDPFAEDARYVTRTVQPLDLGSTDQGQLTRR